MADMWHSASPTGSAGDSWVWVTCFLFTGDKDNINQRVQQPTNVVFAEWEHPEFSGFVVY